MDVITTHINADFDCLGAMTAAALKGLLGEMAEALLLQGAFVLPTRADSHSIASLEAMAMGLPVVATPVGGIVDVVEEDQTGYLVPRDDLAALADRIRRLVASRPLRVRLGLAGRRRVETHFDGETIAATVTGLLERAPAGRRAPAPGQPPC